MVRAIGEQNVLKTNAFYRPFIAYLLYIEKGNLNELTYCDLGLFLDYIKCGGQLEQQKRSCI